MHKRDGALNTDERAYLERKVGLHPLGSYIRTSYWATKKRAAIGRSKPTLEHLRNIVMPFGVAH